MTKKVTTSIPDKLYNEIKKRGVKISKLIELGFEVYIKNENKKYTSEQTFEFCEDIKKQIMEKIVQDLEKSLKAQIIEELRNDIIKIVRTVNDNREIKETLDKIQKQMNELNARITAIMNNQKFLAKLIYQLATEGKIIDNDLDFLKQFVTDDSNS